MDNYLKKSVSNHRIGYGAFTAEQAADEIRALDPKAEISIGMLSPIIGAHTGPGMLAVIFFGSRDGIMH